MILLFMQFENSLQKSCLEFPVFVDPKKRFLVELVQIHLDYLEIRLLHQRVNVGSTKGKFSFEAFRFSVDNADNWSICYVFLAFDRLLKFIAFLEKHFTHGDILTP